MKKNLKWKAMFFCLLLTFVMVLPVQASEIEDTSVTENRLVISNKREFLEFAEKCRLDKYSENLIVVLDADIDLTGNEFDGIPIFCGMFEGNHHTISGLNILENGSAKGLFRYLTEDAFIQNLSVKGKVTPQGSKSMIGGLVGKNAGTILNCSFSGEVDGKDYVGGLIGINEVTGTIENCQVEGKILGIHFVGGIAGENSGVIRKCKNLSMVNTQSQKSNLEVSDITIESLTNSEATYTITDVGGIAGSSSGVIKDCHNQGTVGYQHIGYNIGGIAGSQVGYISNCENQGQVFGRKEVGGIVGQMEPVTNLDFDKDTLQILESQLGVASATIDQSSGNIQTQVNQNTANVNNQVEKLQNDLNHTGDAVSELLKETDLSSLDEINKKIEELEKSQGESDTDKKEEEKKTEEEQNAEILKRLEELQNVDISSLNVDEINRQLEEYRKGEALSVNEVKEMYEQLKLWETIKLPDSDSVQAAKSSLNESMNSMSETLNSITQSGQDTMNTLTEEMHTIMNQAQRITSIVSHASDNIGINFTDVSDADTEDNLLAKIENCKNMGAVQADLNGGGIIGVIAMENNLDPEGELEITGEVSLNLQGELRAVILNCDNQAKVTIRNQNGGGIAGWVFLGLIKNCMNTGNVDAANADYIGGVVGLSNGYIRNSSVKCEISGNSNVGGIVGSGSIVTDCHSMVQLNSGNEKVGNILGSIQENYRKEADPVKNNFYLFVERDFGGIDGISYSGLAEPLDRNSFLKLENLPQEFWKVKVTFIGEDNSYEQILVNHGSSLEPEDIPEVPVKEGYMGIWEGLETANTQEIFFDISFKASYTPVKGTISSKKTINEKPVLLLQGNFNATKEVALIEVDSKPEAVKENEMLESFGFLLKETESATGARYYIPQSVKGEDLRVFVKGPDISWHETECMVDGSYLVFSLKHGENQITILENQTAPSLWGGVALIIAVIFVIAIILERKQNKD